MLALARRNPVLTAHAFCTAQYLSGGRVVAGIGLGGPRPTEYELAGVPLDRRGRITDEYIAVMRRLWAEGSIDHASDEYSVRRAAALPAAGDTDPDLDRRPDPGRPTGGPDGSGDGWVPAFLPPEGYAGAWSQVCEHAVAAGREPSEITPAVYAMAAIGRREGEAEAIARPVHAQRLRRPPGSTRLRLPVRDAGPVGGHDRPLRRRRRAARADRCW